MESLWERLTDEQRNTLNEQMNKYPTLYKSMIMELKENRAWSGLTISTAYNLITDLVTEQTYFINDISKIFENEKI